MSGPITWRNVQGRADTAAAQLLAGAGRSINTAVDQFGSALDAREEQLTTVAEQERDNNTDAFLNRLRTYDNVDDLQAARGDIDTFAQTLGDNVDQDVLRTGFDERLASLRGAETSERSFEQDRARAEANPLAEQYRALKLADDDEGAAKLLEDNADLFSRAGLTSTLASFGDSRDRTELERIRADENQARADAEREEAKSFDQLLVEASKLPSEYDARRFIQENAKTYGVSESVLLKRSNEIAAAWDQTNQLSTSDKVELEGYARTVGNQADAIEQRAKATRDAIFAENVVDPNATWEASTKVSDAAEAAKALNWDPTSYLGGKNLAPLMEEAAAEWLEETEGLTNDERTRIGAFAKRGIEMMGEPSEVFGKENLDKDDFKVAIGRAFKEYKQFDYRRLNRLAAERSYQNELNAALELRNSTREYRKYLKGNALKRLSGE